MKGFHFENVLIIIIKHAIRPKNKNNKRLKNWSEKG